MNIKKCISPTSKYIASSDALLLHDYSIPEIKNIEPNATIIVCIRNPSTRAYSVYQTLVRDRRYTKSYDEFLKENKDFDNVDSFWKAISGSEYLTSITAFKSNFDRVYCVVYEDFARDPVKEMQRIFEFLSWRVF